MANRKSNHLLVLAATECGPHQTYRDAIMALRTHRDPKIAKLANGCTVQSLENRLRRYRREMQRHWPPEPDFMSPVARAALRYVYLAAPHLPDDALGAPDLLAAFIDLLRRIRDEPEPRRL